MEQKEIEKLYKHLKVLVSSFILILVVSSVLAIWHFTPEKTTDLEKVVKVEETAKIVNGIDLESGLKAQEGYETVKRHCGACHSLKLVTQNRSTKEGWTDIIKWMQKTQKLWDLGSDEDIITSYLGKNYAPEEKGRRANLKNIEWYDL